MDNLLEIITWHCGSYDKYVVKLYDLLEEPTEKGMVKHMVLTAFPNGEYETKISYLKDDGMMKHYEKMKVEYKYTKQDIRYSVDIRKEYRNGKEIESVHSSSFVNTLEDEPK